MSENVPTLAILGATGDLTSRLLLPGLGTLLATEPERDVRVIGAAMDECSQDEWKSKVRTALESVAVPAGVVDRVVSSTTFTHTDVLDHDQLRDLVTSLPPGSVLYFALPPQVTAKACRLLGDVDLPEGLRLAIEKPFGFDAASAAELNQTLASLIPEKQTYRIDHFLGKSMVLNLIGLRFANRIFEPVWDSTDIESVEIVADETLALEGRAGYYDGAGALNDMIQSHLLLVLAMFAMEEPASLDEVELRDLIQHVLRATRLAGPAEECSRRARYTAGAVEGRQIPSYVDEPGVDPSRATETLTEIEVEIRNRRWEGVKFLLRSGKALGTPNRSILVRFRQVTHALEGLGNVAPRNTLRLGMSPETIELGIATNGAGDKFELEETTLTATLGDSPVRPYGEILGMILDGNPLLSVRGDTAEECWRILGPVLDAWSAGTVSLEDYSAGSTGPEGWK